MSDETFISATTLDANAEEAGPLWIDEHGTYVAVITGTITVTPQFSNDGVNYAPQAAAPALTASGSGHVFGPGWLKLVASSVSGGSAICTIRRGKC